MQQGDGAIATVLQAHLDALGGELRGARREERLGEEVAELMRLQALLVDDADAAAACLDAVAANAALVDPLRPLARELFRQHRERIARIREAELARADYVARRAAERRSRGAARVPGETPALPTGAP